MFKPIQREESASFDRHAINYIREAAQHGLYEIRGMGAKREVPFENGLGNPLRETPHRTGYTDHDRRDEFWSFVR